MQYNRCWLTRTFVLRKFVAPEGTRKELAEYHALLFHVVDIKTFSISFNSVVRMYQNLKTDLPKTKGRTMRQ